MNSLERFLEGLPGKANLVTDHGTLVRLDPCSDVDVERLFSLHSNAMRPEVERLTSWDPMKQRQRLQRCLDDGAAFVLWRNAEAQAACLLTSINEASIELAYLYVEPAIQDRGLGTSICRAVQRVASAAAVGIDLGVLKGGRPEALYQRLGWVRNGENEWENRFTWGCAA